MFPYPSGAGLHVGHVENYTATDIYSRFKRMQGFNVLHPIGWDAFGLPAENFAIKNGTHPNVSTHENIKNFIEQIKSLGISYDWSREIDTSSPEYYKWTQWFFFFLYKNKIGKKIRAADVCPDCGGWRLRTRGIGIQQVFDEAKEQFPNKHILLLDHITGSTRKKAQKIIDDFYSSRETILVGTQMALPYLNLNGVDLSAIISLDATRSNPTWRADENVFRLLLQLRDISSQEVLVQTRTSPDLVIEGAKHSSLESFYRDELDLRESLNYPPFSTFILLTWTGEKSVVSEVEKNIQAMTSTFEGTYYNSPSSTDAKTLRHALFRLAPTNKTKPDFIEILKGLPPYIRIEIDPQRIV
jgi:hypothetical protein